MSKEVWSCTIASRPNLEQRLETMEDIAMAADLLHTAALDADLPEWFTTKLGRMVDELYRSAEGKGRGK